MVISVAEKVKHREGNTCTVWRLTAIEGGEENLMFKVTFEWVPEGSYSIYGRTIQYRKSDKYQRCAGLVQEDEGDHCREGDS